MWNTCNSSDKRADSQCL
ncbi:binding--dependent transport system inner membrane component family protein, partial [Yersinia pestis PY-64]